MSAIGNHPFKAQPLCIACGETYHATRLYHGYYCPDCRGV